MGEVGGGLRLALGAEHLLVAPTLALVAAVGGAEAAEPPGAALVVAAGGEVGEHVLAQPAGLQARVEGGKAAVVGNADLVLADQAVEGVGDVTVENGVGLAALKGPFLLLDVLGQIPQEGLAVAQVGKLAQRGAGPAGLVGRFLRLALGLLLDKAHIPGRAVLPGAAGDVDPHQIARGVPPLQREAVGVVGGVRHQAVPAAAGQVVLLDLLQQFPGEGGLRLIQQEGAHMLLGCHREENFVPVHGGGQFLHGLDGRRGLGGGGGLSRRRGLGRGRSLSGRGGFGGCGSLNRRGGLVLLFLALAGLQGRIPDLPQAGFGGLAAELHHIRHILQHFLELSVAEGLGRDAAFPQDLAHPRHGDTAARRTLFHQDLVDLILGFICHRTSTPFPLGAAGRLPSV